MPKWVLFSILAISFLGFLDAAYLAASHYLGLSLQCLIVNGCDIVTTSVYSKIFGIPVALFGAIYYGFIFLMGVSYLDSGGKMVFKVLAYSTVAGFLASIWFVYVQLALLDAICLYCMASAVTSTLLFVLSMYSLFFLEEKLKVGS
jgi:uncharacterized membrane protein